MLAAADQDDLIWGHASIRDAAGRGIWIKQSGYCLDQVDASRVHLVAPDGEVQKGGGSPHAEYPIHTEIMAARPDVGAVVHTHPRYATALAAAGMELRAVSHEGTLFTVPAVPRFTLTTDLIVTPELGKQLAHQLGEASAIFLVNHGIVTVGVDIQAATVNAILLERACQQQLLTSQFGGQPTWTDDDEVPAKRERIYGGTAFHRVWDALIHTLPSEV